MSPIWRSQMRLLSAHRSLNLSARPGGAGQRSGLTGAVVDG